MANRLSANSSVTVAVLEAGLDGSAVQDDIDMPAQGPFISSFPFLQSQSELTCEPQHDLLALLHPPTSLLALSPSRRYRRTSSQLTAYFDGVASMTSDYDWHYNTVTQAGLNKTVYWPRGKVSQLQAPLPSARAVLSRLSGLAVVSAGADQDSSHRFLEVPAQSTDCT